MGVFRGTASIQFNAELLNGNAMLIRACGTKPNDGSILRSRKYLLFGNGIATILANSSTNQYNQIYYGDGYIMELCEKRDRRGVTYHEFQPAADQMPGTPNWRLNVSNFPPDRDMGRHIRPLIEHNGDPGQYFFLDCLA